jgi:DNA-directed RNA polymerase specialized sigma24 family protein
LALATKRTPLRLTKATWLAGLTDKQKEVMLLSLLLEKVDIARVLGVKPATVSDHYSKALLRVKETLFESLGRA